jgi:hypothetical protein
MNATLPFPSVFENTYLTNIVPAFAIQHREEMKSIAKLFEAHNTSDSNVSKIHTAPQQPPQTYPNMFSDISQSYSVRGLS